MPFTKDHAFRLVFHFGKILQVNSIQPSLEQAYDFGSILPGSNVMPQIRTGSNSLVVAFDDAQHIDRFVVTVAWPVVMNRDSDVEFLDQIIQVVEGIKVRIGRNAWCPKLLRELKDCSIRGSIFCQAVHTMARNRHP